MRELLMPLNETGGRDGQMEWFTQADYVGFLECAELLGRLDEMKDVLLRLARAKDAYDTSRLWEQTAPPSPIFGSAEQRLADQSTWLDKVKGWFK
jgi:hypothetical protein